MAPRSLGGLIHGVSMKVDNSLPVIAPSATVLRAGGLRQRRQKYALAGNAAMEKGRSQAGSFDVTLGDRTEHSFHAASSRGEVLDLPKTIT